NLLRVVTTVLGARAFGVPAVTAEPAHSLLGLSVYVVGCLLLLAAARALSRAAVPVHDQRLARDPARRVRAQEDDGARHLLGRSVAAPRDPLHRRLVDLRRVLPDQVPGAARELDR